MTARAVDGTASLLTQTLHQRLKVGLQSLQLEVAPAQQQQLIEFVALLVKWNGVYNLTSVRDPVDMLSVHLLDALSIVDLVDRLGGETLLDVGSGAGLPAIPIAIVRPRIVVHSIDAVAKKIGFQLQARSTLGLDNLHPSHARIEATSLPSPALIVSRAFADVTAILDAVDHLADENTRVIAMKGKKPFDELTTLPPGWTVDRIDEFDVPFLGAQRCAVVLRRSPRAKAG